MRSNSARISRPRSESSLVVDKPTISIDKVLSDIDPIVDNIGQMKKAPPIKTAAGGYAHTDESRAKISKANKGKIPWNKNRSHEEDTRAKIRASLAAFHKNKQEAKKRELERLRVEDPEKYAAVVEAEKQKVADRRLKERARKKKKYASCNATELAQLKEEQRQARLRKKPARPRNHTCSQETRMKISETLRRKWQNNETYRRTQSESLNSARTPETNSRISEKLKELWKNGTLNKSYGGPHSESRKQKIAESIRKKWLDPDYRERVTAGMYNRSKGAPRTISEETRAKISEKAKEMWANETWREAKGLGFAGSGEPRRRSRRKLTPEERELKNERARLLRRAQPRRRTASRTSKQKAVSTRQGGRLAKELTTKTTTLYRSPDGLLEEFFGYEW